MNRIGQFVKEAKNWLKLKEPVVFVVGNESCDLDSAVSAVGLAFFYTVTANLADFLFINGKRRFLPIMNISRENLPLKTEVTHFMHKFDIDMNDLVCWNEISPELLNKSNFILVDHHVPTTTPTIPMERIIQIIDHHPLDTNNAQFSTECMTKLSEVGSCATLIANEIRNLENTFANHHELINFIRGPIVVDTINFSESAGKVKPLDMEINVEIEKCLNVGNNDRSQLYNELVKARSDVNGLSALQLLSKDLKVISNSNKSYSVAIPGFPLLVEDYIQKENAIDSVKKFGNERNCDMVVLMGMKELENGDIRRDIGLILLNDSELNKQIQQELTILNRDYLQLEDKNSELFSSVQLFEQKNIRASRKQILPIIKIVLDLHTE